MSLGLHILRLSGVLQVVVAKEGENAAEKISKAGSFLCGAVMPYRFCLPHLRACSCHVLHAGLFKGNACRVHVERKAQPRHFSARVVTSTLR